MSFVNNEAINNILGNYSERIKYLESSINKLIENLNTLTWLHSDYGNVGDFLLSNGNAAPSWQSPVYFYAYYANNHGFYSNSTTHQGDFTNWTEGISNPSGQLSQGKTWTAPEDGIYFININSLYSYSYGDQFHIVETQLYLNEIPNEKSRSYFANISFEDDFQNIQSSIFTIKKMFAGDTLYLRAYGKSNFTNRVIYLRKENTRWNIHKIAE